jgi:hypothetical protein
VGFYTQQYSVEAFNLASVAQKKTNLIYKEEDNKILVGMYPSSKSNSLIKYQVIIVPRSMQIGNTTPLFYRYGGDKQFFAVFPQNLDIDKETDKALMLQKGQSYKFFYSQN